ncbi:hypothetical protein GA0115260_106501, partial [Streptomyces sp. MnatMP-M27]
MLRQQVIPENVRGTPKTPKTPERTSEKAARDSEKIAPEAGQDSGDRRTRR